MGIRTIKTAVAFVLAIFLAETLQLKLATFAGIAAVLGVQTTRMQTLKVALRAFVTAWISIAISALGFYLLGFHYVTLGFIVFLLIPVLVKLKLPNISFSIVVLSHFFASKQISWVQIGQEVLLATIGLGVAIIINLSYMPNTEKKILQTKQEIQTLLSHIFSRLARHLRSPDEIWNGKELLTLDEHIKKGKSLALTFAENRMYRKEPLHLVELKNKEKQTEVLHRIMYHLALIDEALPHNEMMAETLEKMSIDLEEGVPLKGWEKTLDELHQQYASMALPTSRQEFETRAALLQVLLEMKRFIALQENLITINTSAIESTNSFT